MQQGYPLGPFLFCLALQILVRKIHIEIPNLKLNSWYMYDGGLFGSIADVLQAWNLIKEHGPALGLFVNAKKCELILLSGHLDAFSTNSLLNKLLVATWIFLEAQ